MIFAIAVVVIWRAAHFALSNHDQSFANLQLFRSVQDIRQSLQQLRNQLHLILVIVRMAVELANRQIG